MMMGFGFITFLVVAGVVILTALVAGSLLLSSDSSLANIFSAPNKKTSREILEERFVRGEISREEFNAFKAEIEE